MTFENYVKGRLVTYVMERAAHLGAHEPMLAIAQTLSNRVRAGWGGGEWMPVIEAAPDFEASAIKRSVVIRTRDPGFRELLRKIDDVYYGTADDTNVNNETGVALYYAELHAVDRPWFRENILSDPGQHARLATVASLTFFS